MNNHLDPTDERQELRKVIINALSTVQLHMFRKVEDRFELTQKEEDLVESQANRIMVRLQAEQSRTVKEVLKRLYKKRKSAKSINTGAEFKAIHHKDIDYEYYRLTGESLQ